MGSYGFTCLGIFGASVLVAFAADITQVATVHLRMCHILAGTGVYGVRLSISTLWNLFQGIVNFVLRKDITYILNREVPQPAM